MFFGKTRVPPEKEIFGDKEKMKESGFLMKGGKRTRGGIQNKTNFSEEETKSPQKELRTISTSQMVG